MLKAFTVIGLFSKKSGTDVYRSTIHDQMNIGIKALNTFITGGIS